MKLKIDNVSFKNFLSYGSKETTVEFRKGVNIVLGKDKITGRSNGSGKSSFLETVPFALFGQTHKEIKKDQLLNWKNRRNLEVALTFTKGESEYLVRRCIKPDNLEIYENGSLIDKPSHVRDYQATLEEIIGLNFQTFVSLIHSNINSSNRILSMGKPEKRKFIENVFGLEIYSLISAKALEKIRSIEDKLHEIEIKTSTYDTQIDECRSQISTFNDKLKNLTSKEPELKELQAELKELKSEFKDVEDKYKNTVDDIKKKTGDQTRISKLDSKVNAKHSIVERWIKDIDEKLRKVAESKECQKIYLAYAKKNGSPSEVSLDIEKIQAEILNNKELREKAQQKLKDAEIELTKIETKLEADEAKYDGLKYHNECPTCGTNLKGTDGKKLLETLNAAVKLRRIDYEKQTELVKELEEKNSELIQENRRIAYEFARLDEIRTQLYKLKDQVKVEYDGDKLKAQKERYINVSKCLGAQLGRLEKQAYVLENSIQGLRYDQEELEKGLKLIKNKENDIEIVKEKIRLEKQTREEFKAIINTNKEKIEKLLDETAEVQKKRQQYINMVDYLKVVRELCKDDNIKQYAISSIMPYLNQRTNYYLSEVGYSFYTILNRWIEAEIRGPGVTNATYGSLSGGEGRGIDLSLQFSFLDIAKVQAGIWPDILIMDEILDSSVDGAGIDKLMNIIRTKQADEDNKIFIISHRDEIGDIEVDNTYFVEKDSYSHLTIK